MRKEPVEAVPPMRDLASPTVGAGHVLSGDGDPVKKSGEQTTKSMYSVQSDGSPHPAKKRSTMRSVFLVLSCAGAMVINVSAS